MSEREARQLAEALLPAVLAAGALEMRYFNKGMKVELKADTTPVTAADREAEAILVAALAQAAPGVPVVAEESMAAGQAPEACSRFFLVDPLDGTRDFVAGRPEFTINVGLVENGRPVFGMVYVPATGRLFVTTAPEAAAEISIAPDDIRPFGELPWRPIAARCPQPGVLVALDSRSHRTRETADFLAAAGVTRVDPIGSSVKFCLIAAGEADLYARLGPTSQWDTAAGHAILTAAGGSVTTLDGGPLQYGTGPQGYLNPHFVARGRPRP
jgi:3'(2'), 5'-bisphosphate nucleotidase